MDPGTVVGAGGSKTQAVGRGKGWHAFLGCPEQVPRPPRGAAGPGRRGPQPAPPLSPLAAVGSGQGQGQGPFPVLPTVFLAEGPQGQVQAGQRRPRRPEMREALESQVPAQVGRDAASGPGAPRTRPPPPVCLVPGPGRPLRSCLGFSWIPLTLPQGPRSSGQGGGEHVSYLQPSLAGREACPGSVLAAAGCQTPCPEARVRWGQGRRRSWSCCWPLAGVPPGEGVSGGQGAQASWDCGAVAPQQVSEPGSPAPLVFLVGVRERRRPGPGQHPGRWPLGEAGAAPALPGAGAQSPCLHPQLWLRLALLGLPFLGDRGESPGRRPAALEPRPRPSGQAAAPVGWVFSSSKAGLRPHASRSL